MKAIILSVLFLGSIANAQVICKNDNQETQLQTIVVLDGAGIGAICQRSMNPNAPKKSNEEICAKDFFVMQGSGTASGIKTIIHSSVTTDVELVLELSSTEEKNSLEVKSDYIAATLKGSNKVQLAKGKISLSCVEK